MDLKDRTAIQIVPNSTCKPTQEQPYALIKEWDLVRTERSLGQHTWTGLRKHLIQKKNPLLLDLDFPAYGQEARNCCTPLQMCSCKTHPQLLQRGDPHHLPRCTEGRVEDSSLLTSLTAWPARSKVSAVLQLTTVVPVSTLMEQVRESHQSSYWLNKHLLRFKPLKHSPLIKASSQHDKTLHQQAPTDGKHDLVIMLPSLWHKGPWGEVRLAGKIGKSHSCHSGVVRSTENTSTSLLLPKSTT